MNKNLILLAVIFMVLGCTTSKAAKEKAGVHYRLGVSYLNDGNTTRALKELLEAEKLDKTDQLIYNALGMTYYGKDEMDLAAEQYRRALAINPRFSEARNNLGIIYLEKKMWDQAIEEFSKAASDLLYSTPEFSLTNMGWAYSKKGDLVRAIESYKKAMEKNPKYAKPYHDLGKIYYTINKVDDAIVQYKMAIKLFPNYLEAHYDLGLAYLKAGKNDLAKASFGEAVRIAPDTDLGKNSQNYLLLLK